MGLEMPWYIAAHRTATIGTEWSPDSWHVCCASTRADLVKDSVDDGPGGRCKEQRRREATTDEAS